MSDEKKMIIKMLDKDGNVIMTLRKEDGDDGNVECGWDKRLRDEATEELYEGGKK